MLDLEIKGNMTRRVAVSPPPVEVRALAPEQGREPGQWTPALEQVQGLAPWPG
jgi:hypothetical protein